MTVGVFAQGPFTIRRPENGATVRETVKVRIPRSSIPVGGYVGIWINDKFVEAVAPTDKGDVQDGMFIYGIDTKERDLADGKLKIEAALYAPISTEAARIVNKSSVTVTLDNKSSIRPPSGGFNLRYAFKPGREMVYNIQQRVGRSTLSEAQAKLGGRANDVSMDAENFRYMITVDNAYNGGGEGLIHMQPLPPLNKEYAILTTSSDTTPKKYYRYQMSPVYMRLTNTGREIFGRAPYYFGLEASAGRESLLDLFAIIPLPQLPSKGVQVGDTWNASLTIPAIGDPGELYETLKLTKPTQATGVLEGIEYQNGERCARIRNKIAISTSADGDASQEEAFWISLDRGILLKAERTITRTVRVKVQTGGGGGGAAGGAGLPGGRSSGGKQQGTSGPGRMGAQDLSFGPDRGTIKQGLAGKGGRPSGGAPGTPGSFGAPGAGGGGGNTGGAARTTTKIVRERIVSTMTLERVIR